MCKPFLPSPQSFTTRPSPSALNAHKRETEILSPLLSTDLSRIVHSSNKNFRLVSKEVARDPAIVFRAAQSCKYPVAMDGYGNDTMMVDGDPMRVMEIKITEVRSRTHNLKANGHCSHVLEDRQTITT